MKDKNHQKREKKQGNDTMVADLLEVPLPLCVYPDPTLRLSAAPYKRAKIADTQGYNFSWLSPLGLMESGPSLTVHIPSRPTVVCFRGDYHVLVCRYIYIHISNRYLFSKMYTSASSLHLN